jgi:TolB protein
MKTIDSFDRRLATWLHEETEGRVGDHLAEVLVASRATRQRPGWSSPGRWLPVDIPLRIRMAPAPGLAWLLVVLAALVALTATAVYFGTQPKVLEPDGLAANGVIVYAGPDGDIYALDPTNGVSRPLITGTTADQLPTFSRDGLRIAFARLNRGEAQLVIAGADGAIIRSIVLPALPTAISWSPDGTRLAIVDASANTFSIVAADGSGIHPVDLDLRADHLSWRPGGRELVFAGVASGPASGTFGLYVVRADGGGLRAVIPPATDESAVQGLALSPDGSTILYTNWPSGGYLYAADLDSGTTVRVAFDPSTYSDYFPAWSPDGSRIVFNRGVPQDAYFLAVASPAGGPAVRIGPVKSWNAAAHAAFSPDGTNVIARYSDGEIWLLDVAGGEGTRLDDALFADLASWQRLAP